MAIQLHPKMSATVVAGAITSLIVAEFNRRGLSLAPDEAAALTTLLAFIAGYFMPGDTPGGNGNGNGADAAAPAAPVAAAPPAIVAPPAPVVAPPAPSAGIAPLGITPLGATVSVPASPTPAESAAPSLSPTTVTP